MGRSKQKISGHGGLGKSGKVRGQTPKIPITVKHKPSFPRIANKNKYRKVLLNRKSGQNWMEKQKRGRHVYR